MKRNGFSASYSSPFPKFIMLYVVLAIDSLTLAQKKSKQVVVVVVVVVVVFVYGEKRRKILLLKDREGEMCVCVGTKRAAKMHDTFG